MTRCQVYCLDQPGYAGVGEEEEEEHGLSGRDAEQAAHRLSSCYSRAAVKAYSLREILDPV